MTSDSLQHLLDSIRSIPHIIDSTKVIIQNNIPPSKSDFDWVPYIAVAVSIIALFVNYFLTKKQIESNTENVNRQIVENNESITKQIKNSQELLEKTIAANREVIVKQKLLDVKLKLIEEFGIISNKIHNSMSTIVTGENEIYKMAKSELSSLIVLQKLLFIRLKVNQATQDLIQAQCRYYMDNAEEYRSNNISKERSDVMNDEFINSASTYLIESVKLMEYLLSELDK